LRISADPRHRGLITVFERENPERDFPAWSMGFHSANKAEAGRLPGYSDFLSATGCDTMSSHAKQLLLFFKELNS
jgi:hypothetical protein